MVVLVSLAGLAEAQSARALAEIAQEDARDALRIGWLERRGTAAVRTATDVSSVIGVEGSDRYRIGLGVYGAEYPSIYQDETWIWVACFSQPGVSKVGWTLIRVDIRLYRNGRMVLDTADKGLSLDETNGSTVCDIGKGVDASFFDIDRSLVFDQWEVYVTNAEKNEENLTTGAVIRPRIDPRSCNVSENCRQSTVTYEYPTHLYGR